MSLPSACFPSIDRNSQVPILANTHHISWRSRKLAEIRPIARCLWNQKKIGVFDRPTSRRILTYCSVMCSHVKQTNNNSSGKYMAMTTDRVSQHYAFRRPNRKTPRRRSPPPPSLSVQAHTTSTDSPPLASAVQSQQPRAGVAAISL
jgi:hypothetical protein